MNYLNCLEGIVDYTTTKEILQKKNLIVKEFNKFNKFSNLFLVKYDKSQCDMTDSDIKKCRGLILEKNTNRLVCVPPLKSENIEQISGYDLKDLIVEDFPDGTMINVFKYNNELLISTRSTIGANCRYYSDKSFKLLFEESIDDETFEKLNGIDEGISISFVLQHPENIIVSKYNSPKLSLVHGCIVEDSNITFKTNEEMRDYLLGKNMDFEVPKKYSVRTFEEIYALIEKMGQYQQGLVIKYISNSVYIRTKLRNDYYNYVRDLKGNSNNKKYIYLELRRFNGLEEYFKYYPEDFKLFESYRIELYNMTTNLFNFYQDCFVRKNTDGKREKYIKDVDFEYRPLCIDLHNIYKMDKIRTDKRKIIVYINNLPSAKILFILNYKNYPHTP